MKSTALSTTCVALEAAEDCTEGYAVECWVGELEALRKVADAAKAVLRDGWNGNSEKHARLFMQLGDELAALDRVKS